MDDIELIASLEHELAAAEECVDQMARLGGDLAEAERDYRVALGKELLAGRDAGIPVTILPDICRGNETVAVKRLRRDCAQAILDANTAAYNLHKKRADAIRDEIKAEWWRAGQ